jgi:hypothetical protein
MAMLGTEKVLNGEMRSELASGDCISKAARRQSASLGMRILAMIPTFTARGV